MSSERERSHFALSVPVTPSTSSEEPILTTSRLAFDHSCLMAAIPASRGAGGALRLAPAPLDRSAATSRSAGFMPSPVTAERTSGLRPGNFSQALRLPLQLVGWHGVGLRQRHDLGLLLKPRAIGLELAANDLIGLGRILERRIDEMQQHGATLHMAQEAVAEAGALMRAFDQPGNVGKHEIRRHRPAPRRDWDGAW